MATSMSQSRSRRAHEEIRVTASQRITECKSAGNVTHSHTRDSNSFHQTLQNFYKNRKIELNKFDFQNIEYLESLQGHGIEILECDTKQNKVLLQMNDAEIIAELVPKLMKSYDVSVVSGSKLLCIAQLPENYKDDQLQKLVQSYGTTSRCFMCRCPHTGDNLGYGFVEFDGSIDRQVQNELDWHCVDNHPVHCELVDVTSYEKLLSRCLLIDNLPKDFTDVMALRDIFSKFTSPLYCQIVMKGSESLGFGIIEYKTHQEAERSRSEFNNHMIHNQPIRLTYCVPGKSGIFMCSRIISKFGNAIATHQIKKGLLPDPVFPKESLIKTPLVKQLCQQHPELMSIYKQSLDQLQQSYVNQVTKSSKPGLLGPAPTATLNPLINPNLQLGLIVLLALQLQSRAQNKIIGPLDLFGLLQQNQKESVLGNPLATQASIILKSLTSQLSMGQSLVPNVPINKNLQHKLPQTSVLNMKNINMNSLINLGQLASSLQNSSGNVVPQSLDMMAGLMGNKPKDHGMLRQSNITQRSNMTHSILGDVPEVYKQPNIHGNKPQSLVNMTSDNRGISYENNLKTNSQSEYLNGPENSLISAVKENIPFQPSQFKHNVSDNPFDVQSDFIRKQQTYLQTSVPVDNHFKSSRNSSIHYQGLSQVQQCMVQRHDQFEPSDNESLLGQYSLSLLGQPSGGIRGNTSHTDRRSTTLPQGQNGLMPPPDVQLYSKLSVSSHSQMPGKFSRLIEQSFIQSQEGASPLLSADTFKFPKEDFSYQYTGTKRSRSNTSSLSDYSDCFTDQSSLYDSYRSNDSLFSSGGSSTPVSLVDDGLLKTPIGQKRSYSHLLPPPEPSPEGEFIGQHSQGIGGHYADSYRKRPRIESQDLKLRY